MPKKTQRSKMARKPTKRTKVTAKPVKETKAATKSTRAHATAVTRSKAARANISEGTRFYALAGRPTKAQFIKVYGAKGPAMTWAQRAKVELLLSWRWVWRIIGRNDCNAPRSAIDASSGFGPVMRMPSI